MNYKSPLLLGLFLFFSCISVTCAQTQRNNELQKVCGGPYTDLSEQSRAAASQYIVGWIKASQALGDRGFKDGKLLQEVYEKELLPSLLPLKNGTPSEQKVFLAGEQVFKTIQYAGDNFTHDGPWLDKKMNALLRLSGKPVTIEKLAGGMGNLFVDFFQMINPAAVEQHLQSLDEAGRAKEIKGSFGE